jgi:hypothetical protein
MMTQKRDEFSVRLADERERVKEELHRPLRIEALTDRPCHMAMSATAGCRHTAIFFRLPAIAANCSIAFWIGLEDLDAAGAVFHVVIPNPEAVLTDAIAMAPRRTSKERCTERPQPREKCRRHTRP